MPDHDLAEMIRFPHLGVGFRRVLEAEFMADNRLEPVVGHRAQHVLEAVAAANVNTVKLHEAAEEGRRETAVGHAGHQADHADASAASASVHPEPRPAPHLRAKYLPE